MIDFRYHVTSIVAVFLALAIGVVLGLALNDAGLVSNATRDVERSLRKDLRNARQDSTEARSGLAEANRNERRLYPLMVTGRLEGYRIAVVSLGKLDGGVVDDVRNAVDPAGGRLSSVSAIAIPPDLDALAGRLKGTPYASLDTDPDDLRAFGERIGQELAGGGRLVRRTSQQLFDSHSGAFGAVDGVVFMRSRTKLSEDERASSETLQRSILKGARGSPVATVGVEASDTIPSQTSYFKDQKISTVDNVDQISGRVSLVFVLLGAHGAFGTKENASELLPEEIQSPAPPAASP